MRYEELKALNADVITVSTDSVHSHKVWNETELSKMIGSNVPFAMASDLTGNIGRLYDVYDENEGVNIRGIFLIDPEGIVQACEILSPAVGRNPEEIIRLIKAFQHNQLTCEVLPSGWREGDKTLKPSTALAGKVWQEWQAPQK